MVRCCDGGARVGGRSKLRVSSIVCTAKAVPSHLDMQLIDDVCMYVLVLSLTLRAKSARPAVRVPDPASTHTTNPTQQTTHVNACEMMTRMKY